MKIESKAMKEKERNYDKMTEEEALEILRKEWPDYSEETEQMLKDGCHGMVEWLSVLDSFG